jgi:hypothetical protein
MLDQGENLLFVLGVGSGGELLLPPTRVPLPESVFHRTDTTVAGFAGSAGFDLLEWSRVDRVVSTSSIGSAPAGRAPPYQSGTPYQSGGP